MGSGWLRAENLTPRASWAVPAVPDSTLNVPGPRGEPRALPPGASRADAGPAWRARHGARSGSTRESPHRGRATRQRRPLRGGRRPRVRHHTPGPVRSPPLPALAPRARTPPPRARRRASRLPPRHAPGRLLQVSGNTRPSTPSARGRVRRPAAPRPAHPLSPQPPPACLCLSPQRAGRGGRLTMRNWAWACCSRPSRSACAVLTKMPTSGLNCRALPCRRATKWPKLRMQQMRTTACEGTRVSAGGAARRLGPQLPRSRRRGRPEPRLPAGRADVLDQARGHQGGGDNTHFHCPLRLRAPCVTRGAEIGQGV